MPHGSRSLQIFISSTADLKAERDVVQQALETLDIDGRRFESWPPSPNPPLVECFSHIEEADALILLLGQGYGTIALDGLSATHAEYRHALKHRKPVFAFLLKCGLREPEEAALVAEVEKSSFRGAEIRDLDDLRNAVRCALLVELTVCFRKVHTNPPEQPSQVLFAEPALLPVVLPQDRTKAVELLGRLYQEGHEAELHALRLECLSRFGSDAIVLNLVYTVEVNRGISARSFDARLVQDAVSFWQSNNARRRWEGYSLLYNQGNALLALKRYAAAVEKYEEALGVHPSFAECWKNLGSSHQSLGRRDSAKKCYEKALSYKPDLFEALYCLGAMLATESEQTGRALNYMNTINLDILPLSLQAAVLGWRSILFLRLGMYSEGIASGERAIRADPSQERAWKNTANLYAVARRNDKRWLKPASEFWERFIGRFPKSAEAYSELGFTLWFLGQEAKGDEEKLLLARKSLQAFENTIRYGQRDNGLVWDRIGHLHENLGNLSEAEKAFVEAVGRDRPQFLYCLADCLLARGRSKEALPLALESAQKHQCDAHGWYQVGACYSELRMFEEATAAFAKAIGLDPEYPNPWFDLGGSYWNRGLRAKALEVWADAVKRFPGHVLAKRVERFLASEEED